MSHFTSSRGFAGRGPAGHLERLHDGLTALGQQVREAIARTIGLAVADAARDGVRHLLGGPIDSPALPAPRRRLYDSPSPSWRDPERTPYRHEYEDPDRLDDLTYRDWRDEPLDRAEEDDYLSETPTAADKPQRVEWPGALAAGCQAAAWWLRRQRGPYPGLVALGVGLAALLACLAVPTSPATAVLTAAVGLASLADVV
jgi:hypothetical protein